MYKSYQMTDIKYHARITSYFYSVWIPHFELRYGGYGGYGGVYGSTSIGGYGGYGLGGSGSMSKRRL